MPGCYHLCNWSEEELQLQSERPPLSHPCSGFTGFFSETRAHLLVPLPARLKAAAPTLQQFTMQPVGRQCECREPQNRRLELSSQILENTAGPLFTTTNSGVRGLNFAIQTLESCFFFFNIWFIHRKTQDWPVGLQRWNWVQISLLILSSYKTLDKVAPFIYMGLNFLTYNNGDSSTYLIAMKN